MNIESTGGQEEVARGLLLTEGNDCTSDRSVAAHVTDGLIGVTGRMDLVNYRLQNSIVHVVRQSVQVHLTQMGSAQVQFHSEEAAERPLDVDYYLERRRSNS